MAHQFLKDTNNDIVALAQILGHENLNTTKIYSQKSNADLAYIAEKLSYWKGVENVVRWASNGYRI